MKIINTLPRQLMLYLLISASAPAMAIYKCESDGKPVYSDAPCAGGKMLDIATAPTVTDTNSAKRQAADEKVQLQRIEKERQKQEAQEEKERKKRQQQASRAQTAKHKKCSSLERRKRWAEEDAAAATGKSVNKAKQKVRRATEQFSAECGN